MNIEYIIAYFKHVKYPILREDVEYFITRNHNTSTITYNINTCNLIEDTGYYFGEEIYHQVGIQYFNQN